MKYTHVLWDFNGTILDDVQTGIDSVNVMLAKRGLPTLKDVADYRAHFRFPITAYYESLGFDFEKEPFALLAPEWVALYLEFVKKASLREGVINALDDFKNAGLKQVIVSATEYNMLTCQLCDLGIRDKFDDYIGLDNIHAASKTELAKEWYAANKPEKAVFIGDTTHDFEVASALGCDCILVAGGHQTPEVLDKCGTCVVHSIIEAKNTVMRHINAAD